MSICQSVRDGRMIRVGFVALLSLPAIAAAQDTWRHAGVSRVVAFGDVHGAYSQLTELLRATGIVDANLAWSGDDAHLVSLGDLLDRGADSRAVMELLMRLQTEAVAAGGRVHVVVGNHELMNLTGDLRYVSAGEYAAFAADETAAMRDEAYAALVAADEATPVDRAAFDRRYPRGYFAHREAFALDGRYGSWLASLPLIVAINSTAFVHGGLPPLVVETPLATLNGNFQAKLRRYLELRSELAAHDVLPAFDMQRDFEHASAALESADDDLKSTLEEFLGLADAPELGSNSPLWYRGSIYCKPILEEPILDAALAQLGVERVVVGHTPGADRNVRAVYDGKLVTLDTGMLTAYYNGRPAALVLEGRAGHVQYLAPLERVSLGVAEALIAYGMTETQLTAALEKGAVASFARGDSEAPWQVELNYANATLRATFYPEDDGGDLELAAAALDELLGAALVPPTVQRSIDGTEGALQLRYPDAVSETERLERGLGLSSWCPIESQLQLLYAFDLLTYNRGRSGANVFYGNELSDLTITDHGRAFGEERTLPSGFDTSTLRLPAALIAAMRTLDTETLEAELGEWLGPRQIRGLLARRDRLVADR